MTDPRPEDLVLPHLTGTLHGEEAEHARALLEATASQRGALAGLRVALQHEELRRGAPDIRRSLAQFWSRVEQSAALSKRQTLHGVAAHERHAPPFAGGLGATWRRRVNGRAWQLRSAGVAAIAAVAAAIVLWRSGPRRDAGTTTTYATTTGQLATVHLRDGTRVTMAPQTTLRLVGFGRSARTVEVDGEAYFEVTRATGAPFTIRSGDVVTRVLGTAFTVRHYRNDQDVRVAVASGKVNVFARAARRPAATVTAGHVAHVAGVVTRVTTADTAATEPAWMYDRLVFDEAPMTEVFATLSRWYGYEFRCADSTMARRNVTVGLSARSSAEALATLEQLLNVKLRIEGRTVTLTPQAARMPLDKTRQRTYDAWTPTREVGR